MVKTEPYGAVHGQCQIHHGAVNVGSRCGDKAEKMKTPKKHGRCDKSFQSATVDYFAKPTHKSTSKFTPVMRFRFSRHTSDSFLTIFYFNVVK